MTDQRERGPLYGIPISVKECFYLEGYDTTIGLAKHINCPSTEDSPFVAVRQSKNLICPIPVLIMQNLT